MNDRPITFRVCLGLATFLLTRVGEELSPNERELCATIIARNNSRDFTHTPWELETLLSAFVLCNF